MTGRTVDACKEYLKMLAGAVEVKNKEKYDEAIHGLQGIQLMLCQSFAREKAWEQALRDVSKMGDAQFFRIYFGMIDEANRTGANDYFEVFGDETN